MKTEWSPNWTASKQPRRQRKYVHNAPIHIRRKIMSANLSKELRTKYTRRSFPVRVGDKVKVLRGQFKGKITEIENVDIRNYKLYLKDVNLKKEGGQMPVRYPITPSNVQIITFNLDDKGRIKRLEKK